MKIMNHLYVDFNENIIKMQAINSEGYCNSVFKNHSFHWLGSNIHILALYIEWVHIIFKLLQHCSFPPSLPIIVLTG